MLGLKLLDGFYLEVNGREQHLGQSSRRLVAHLALRGRPSRGSVAGQLWPDVSEQRAQGSLRAALHRIQASHPGIVRGEYGSLWLDDLIEVDIREVTRWARDMIAHPEDDSRPITGFFQRLPRSAFTGELLPGWYEEWVLQEREQFRQLRLHALETLSERLARVGAFGEALHVAHSALREEPLRESTHRAIIGVHLAEGNVVEALRQFRHYRDQLKSEVGVAPTRLIIDLFRGVPAHLLEE